jgi:hypothetical protein
MLTGLMDEDAAPFITLDESLGFKDAKRSGDGIGAHAHVFAELPYGGQSLAGFKLTFANLTADSRCHMLNRAVG